MELIQVYLDIQRLINFGISAERATQMSNERRKLIVQNIKRAN